MKLLIIDDDAVDRMATIRTLKESGLVFDKIVQVDNADDGVTLANTENFDLVLLDYQLPPSNGIEVLRLLRRASHLFTAVVMLSHSSDEKLALRCVEAGAQDFLMKSEVSAMRLKRAILLAKERFLLEQQVRQSHEQLRELAERDSLTGLANRYFFDETLKTSIHRAKRESRPIGLLLLDLDRFKQINDTLGHAAGDHLLREVASRLKKPVRQGDVLSRLGGDEFAILIQDLVNVGQVRILIHRLMEEFKVPINMQGHSIVISISVGVATYPDCATDAAELLKCADVAMYRSKEAGRNQVQYYSRTVHDQMQYRIYFERELNQALEKNQLELFYQPQVDPVNFKLLGVEALIRWNHPDLGLVSPLDFIPIAEESGLINEIGRWVLDAACKQYAEWIKLSGAFKLQFTIAANLSARQLKDAGLVEYLKLVINRYDVPVERIELELTESSLESSLSAIEILNSLASYGVKLALDDFGTGYSSLSLLQEYPFDILKIDKMFVQSAGNEAQSAFLKAMAAFAHSLNYETVAEGIETESQKEMCASLGIDRLQGYYFSKPLSADEFAKVWICSS